MQEGTRNTLLIICWRDVLPNQDTDEPKWQAP